MGKVTELPYDFSCKKSSSTGKKILSVEYFFKFVVVRIPLWLMKVQSDMTVMKHNGNVESDWHNSQKMLLCKYLAVKWITLCWFWLNSFNKNTVVTSFDPDWIWKYLHWLWLVSKTSNSYVWYKSCNFERNIYCGCKFPDSISFALKPRESNCIPSSIIETGRILGFSFDR